MEFFANLRGNSSIPEAAELQCTFAKGQDEDEIGEGEDGDDTKTWTEMFELPSMLRDDSRLKYLRLPKFPFSNRFLKLHHLTHLEIS